MAVESRHLHLFPPQLLRNREGGTMTTHPVQANASMYSSQPVYGLPLSGTSTADSFLFPLYNPNLNNTHLSAARALDESLRLKTTPLKSESGITYINNAPLPSLSSSSRKRPRDSDQGLSFSTAEIHPDGGGGCGRFAFLGDDVSLHVHHQFLDIDRLISQHMEKLRAEMDEQRKSQARRLAESIGQGLAKRLRAREEEIQKIGRLNYALEERIKSLCIENQIWRDLAQTNEATANALRTNLEQVLLAQVKTAADDAGETAELDDAANHRRNGGGVDDNALTEDAQSCCGSSGGGGGEGECEGRRGLAGEEGGRGWCRECGKEEARVLILPCRHLCLCRTCEPSCRACPVCRSAKNASFVVNVE
ncbi:probable BOI-related E3 ubiquitin-protein ligase 3 isoform X2 [Rhodamnia argentea]|uniref:Probable BOI-related E3 ubiquitin-protein ligase 3 isoform X2 n=1 Tax=Rhodamnia argentea TaxID=178133 RepID=A0A8B8NU01_9MYRT|nr:probable BOI-related E3 ubiquitin-protein ligase 3 isoform X2 [Rhodamnia argentea]